MAGLVRLNVMRVTLFLGRLIIPTDVVSRQLSFCMISAQGKRLRCVGYTQALGSIMSVVVMNMLHMVE
ncbi:hypothetical protein VcTj87_17480 [Vibrio comitans]